MPDYAIEAAGLTKSFGKTVALDAVDLAVPPGAVLGVLGPNGAGKTTALRILATLLRPDEGTASVAGLDVVRHASRVRRLIGLTGQYASVDEDLTGGENLALIGELLDLGRAAAKARAGELLDRFGLADAADRRVSTYSGGMRRRLDLAASLVARPRVVFLDEPSTGLDPGKRDDLWRTIRSMTTDGGTVLLTTQYLEEADALADEIVVMDRGRVIAQDTPSGLKRIVGGQTIVVRPSDPGRLGEAATIVGRAAGRGPTSVTKDLVTVPVDGGGAFTDAVRGLDVAGIHLAEISLRLPSLDEVFCNLTGQQPSESSPAAYEEVSA